MPKKKPDSREERLRKKRECEKRRRERLKQSPEQLQKLKDLKHKIYIKAKESGRVKSVRDMSNREKRQQRKSWKTAAQKYRNKKKSEEVLNNLLHNNTPPSSENGEVDDLMPMPPSPVQDNEHQLMEIDNEQREGKPSKVSSSQRKAETDPPKESSQKKRGRKLVRRDRSKAYRNIKKQEEKIKELQKKVAKWKKRAQRAVQPKTPKDITPRKKVKQILKGRVIPPDIRKKLLFGEILRTELATKFRSVSKSQREKQIFVKAVSGRIIKRYRMLRYAKEFFPRRLAQSNLCRSDLLMYGKAKKSSVTLNACVREFLERDDNSCLRPGKKDATGKIKTQKRYLTDTMENLHKKFLSETDPENRHVSYPTFCRLRPKWIQKPTLRERDTCLCTKHENIKLLAEKLYSIKIISTSNVTDLLKTLTCEIQESECLARTCKECKNKEIAYNIPAQETLVQLKQWINKKETVYSTKKQKDIIVRKTLKESTFKTTSELVQMFDQKLKPFMKHIRNIKHQYLAMKTLKDNLSETDILFHVDYSENYGCKYAQEVQSFHFGGSREQVVLHTGVVYAKSFKESFCTLSRSLRKDAHAVMAHLTPVIVKYKERFPLVTTLHFLSDSPSTQYRNKTMFALIEKYLLTNFPGIDTVFWNYSESGHGKGAPDGVGAVLKRTADRITAEGKDVNSFEAFYETLKANVKGVHLDVVYEHQITEIEQLLSEYDVVTFKGSMKVHQVISSANNETMFRTLTCYSCINCKCKHFHLGDFQAGLGYLFTGLLSRTDSHGEPYKAGEWVVVIYDGQEYPGEIIEANPQQEEYSVSVMHRACGNRYKWPKEPDILLYNQEHVVKKISPPTPCDSRAAYFIFNNMQN